jgi:hypothetical protein
VSNAVGRRPDEVAGKPYRPLFDETVHRVGASRPLMVGDRLDTDIEGAVNCGADSLLVMTGVTTVAGLCHAREGQRPDYVARTLDGLLASHPSPESDGPAARSLRGWKVAVGDGVLEIAARGSDPDDALRAGAEACWEWIDAHAGDELDTHALDDAISGTG